MPTKKQTRTSAKSKRAPDPMEQEDGAGETAAGYTDQFLDAAIAKIDQAFGPGFAKVNPSLVAAYIAACAQNLNSFMQATSALQGAMGLDLTALENALRD